MKRFLLRSTMVLIVLAMVLGTGCGKKDKDVAPGKVDLFSYIPKDVSGVLMFDFGRFSKLEFFDEMIKADEQIEDAGEKKIFESYQDFVNKTGIDPKTDIHGMAAAFIGEIKGTNPDFIMVANVDHDKEKVLAVMKEKNAEYSEEMYGEQAVYTVQADEEEMAFSFLSSNLVALGKIEQVKQVIDLTQKKGESVLKNEKLAPYIQNLQSDNILFFAFTLPEEVKNMQQQGSPFNVDLSSAEMVYGFGDYNNDIYSGEITVVSPNEEGNKQIVTTLNGLKGMGAMAGPEVAELLNNITISSSAKDISLKFSFSNELLKKLREKSKEKSAGEIEPGIAE